MVKKQIIVLFLLSACVTQGQKLKSADKQIVNNLKRHIQYLASDELEGRRTGTDGEKKAAAYIRNEFKNEGLLPKGTEGFFQYFTIDEGRQEDPSTSLFIDGRQLFLDKDFFPLSNSPNANLESSLSIALKESGTPWFYDVKEVLEENSTNPHFDIYNIISEKVTDVQKKGATALVLYNTSKKDDELVFDPHDGSSLFPIPVIYIRKQAAHTFLNDESATLNLKLKVSISKKIRTAVNVIGYIDNKAEETVLLGAHFDHLGKGEDGNSLELNKKDQIHNGADDNASGTAALIELGSLLKNSRLKNKNYLLIAFSGEELGLYGSKYFTQNPTIDLSNVDFMINMDMVGRLNDSSHVLTVGGYGTTAEWGEIYQRKGRHGLYDHGLVFHFDSSGMGPSDHTSFYLKGIPVLFYFTGLHPDYHKPTDDFEKINYTGEMEVVKHIYSLLQEEDKVKNKLAFLKTRDMQMGNSTHFSVTLGIMPDYTYSGSGVRVDGVSENRPAQKAGIQTGDIIVSLGDNKVTSLENYMQALGKFKKGEKTTVIYKRGDQVISGAIEF